MLDVRLETPTKVVAYTEGEQVGAATFSTARWHFHPRIFYVWFTLAQTANPAEVARALYEKMWEVLEPKNPLLLYTGAEEDSPLLPALRSLGFREFRRVYSPTLDVQTFDLSRLDAHRDRAEALGYRIATLKELELTDNGKKQLSTLFNEVYADTSTVVPATPERFNLGEWWADVIEDEDVIPEAFFVALKDDEMVGFGNLLHGYLYPDSRGSELGTATFGTARRYRHHHREIMLALKAREIAYAKAHGYRTLRAEIDAENPWILQICAELPFVQGKDYVSLVRVPAWTV